VNEAAPPAAPPPPDRSLAYAIAASILLLAVAIAGGVGASRLARPSPSPSPSPTPFVRVSPSPPPDTGPFVFTQTLSAGCVAGSAVYVVSDGGGIGRFADDQWQLIDPTARSLVAAACVGDRLIAVGGGGRVITIDDREQTIRSDAIQLDDLLGVSPLGDGVLVVGRVGSVQRQAGGTWGIYAGGIDEDLYAIAAFGPASAWAVGAGGVTYRLEPAGWRPVASGVPSTLRAIAARSVDDAVAVGDDGVILVWDGAWKGVAAPAPVTLRAALRTTDATYVAGDQGTLLRVTGGQAAPAVALVDLGTKCTLRGLFARGAEIWVIGSDGGHAAVWRLGPNGIFHWGECP
jgi:hypothetical protein